MKWQKLRDDGRAVNEEQMVVNTMFYEQHFFTTALMFDNEYNNTLVSHLARIHVRTYLGMKLTPTMAAGIHIPQ